MAKRSPTTKDVALLHQLYKNGQISLASEFQRNSIWSTPAKVNDRPIPLPFFQRTTSAQTGHPSYTVVEHSPRARASMICDSRPATVMLVRFIVPIAPYI
jgi:hypothetical protein